MAPFKKYIYFMSLEKKNTLNCHTAVQCEMCKYDRELAKALYYTILYYIILNSIMQVYFQLANRLFI